MYKIQQEWVLLCYIVKNKWTVAQVNLLMNNYGKLKDEEISEMTGKTLKAIRRKRAEMGLKKQSGRGICAKLVNIKLPADGENNNSSTDVGSSGQSLI